MFYSLAFVMLFVIIFEVFKSFSAVFCRKLIDITYPQSANEKSDKEQLQSIELELKGMSMMDEFAKYARLERKKNTLQDSIQKLSQKRKESFLKLYFGWGIIVSVLQAVGFISVVWAWQGEPLVLLPADWFYPLSSLIAFPTGVAGVMTCVLGGVGVVFWLMVCQSSVRQVKRFTSHSADVAS